MLSYYDVIARYLPNVDYHQHRYARALEQHVFDGCRWLDVGAGTSLHGGWEAAAPELLAASCSQVVGCDLARDHLARNSELDEAVVADASGLPFASESFDLVTANMVVEHLRRPRAVLTEIRRLLTSDGIFLLVTPNRLHPVVLLLSTLIPPRLRGRLLAVSDDRECEHVFRTYYRANTRRALERAASEAGLRIDYFDPFFSFPMVRRPVVATLAEAVFIRASIRLGWDTLGSNIVAALRPESAP